MLHVVPRVTVSRSQRHIPRPVTKKRMLLLYLMTGIDGWMVCTWLLSGFWFDYSSVDICVSKLCILVSKGYSISLKTIMRCQISLGWTFRESAYCQLIRDINKQKQLAWVLQYQGDSFDNVIWTDESTIQLDKHQEICCRKKENPPSQNQGMHNSL